MQLVTWILSNFSNVKEVKEDVNSMKKELRDFKENEVDEMKDELSIIGKYKFQIISYLITAVLMYYLGQLGG